MSNIVELKANNGQLRTLDMNDISSFEEQTFFNNGTDFIHYTEISLKNGHKVFCNKEAYETIKKYFEQKDQYWNL